jgi:O-antigen ligase
MVFAQDRRLIAPSLLVCLVAALVATALPSGVMAATTVVAAIGLTGPTQATFALLLLLYLRISNPAFSGQDLEAGTGPGLVGIIGLLLCSARIWINALAKPRIIADSLPAFTVPYVVTILMLSLFASSDPTISFLKVLSFFIPMGAVVMGIHIVMQQGRQLLPYVTTLWIFVLVLSIPTLAIPSVGYFRDGMGFQGILNHPQGLAVFLAPIVSFSLIRAITQTESRSLSYIAICAVSIAFLWLTRGRTGFGAILLGFILLMLLRPGFTRAIFVLVRDASMRLWLVAGSALALVILLVTDVPIVEMVSNFVFKDVDAAGLSGAYKSSRGFIVDQAIANFRSNPLTGIGFGISNSSTHVFNVQIDPLTGLPVGAATEKANLLLAVVEETGIIGTFMFAPFIFLLVRRMARTPDLSLAWCAMAALCTNVAETTFFSFGGIGLYTWLIMSCALAEQARPASEAAKTTRAILPAPVLLRQR